MSRISTASELRAKAKGSLKGRWLTAVIAFLLFSAFAAGSTGGSISFDLGSFTTDTSEEEVVVESNDATTEMMVEKLNAFMEDGDAAGAIVYLIMDTVVGLLLVLALLIAVLATLYNIFIAAPVKTGYYRFNLDLYSRSNGGKLDTMWFGFKQCYWKSVGAFFLQSLVIALNAFGGFLLFGFFLGLGAGFGSNMVGAVLTMIAWIALFWTIIRLVLLALDYSMVGYLVADRADLSARQILKASKQMMLGNRWRLVMLRLSFIGWAFVVLLTFGLGSPFLGAYMNAADAAFYRELPRAKV